MQRGESGCHTESYRSYMSDDPQLVRFLPVDAKTVLLSLTCTYGDYAALAHEHRDMLNTRRMEVRIGPLEQAFLAAYPYVMHWLVLVSDDMPETPVILPLLARMAEIGPRIDLRILSEETDFAALQAVVDDSAVFDSLMDAELPLLLVFDEEWQLQEQWGPHPQAMETYLEEWLERHPEYEALADDDSLQGSQQAQDDYARLLDKLIWDMRVWLNTELDRICATEICRLLSGLVDEDELGDYAGIAEYVDNADDSDE
jgi:hypothetical protein